jgi:tetratricopeptide (TPR) repeat protein
MGPRPPCLVRLLSLLCTTCLLLCAGDQTLYAQDGTDAEEASRAQAERGIRAFAQADYATAVTAFQRADQLLPNPAFAYDTGRAYEELHAPQRALLFYRDYLRRAPNAPDRAEVQTRIAALGRRRTDQQTHKVWLRTQPAGATVWIDTEPVGRSPVAIELPTGVHRAAFRLPGHRAQQVQFELQSGQRALNVDAKLAPDTGAAIAGAHAAQAPRASTERSPSTTGQTRPALRSMGFGAVLASVTALGGALAFEVMRADSERGAAQERDQQRAMQAGERAQTQKTWSRVFAGAGGGLAAIGITLLVLSRDEHADRPTSRVALHCAPTKCRAELSGVF